jgi:Mn2+/Fe2+ NRAMP family transporter
LWINFTNIDPIKALVYSAIINGIVAVPILIAVIKTANDREILKDKINSRLSNIIGLVVIVIMGISIVLMLLTWKNR